MILCIIIEAFPERKQLLRVFYEKNKIPETFVEVAMIFPRIKGLPKRLWTGKFYRNLSKIFVFQKTFQL